MATTLFWPFLNSYSPNATAPVVTDIYIYIILHNKQEIQERSITIYI